MTETKDGDKGATILVVDDEAEVRALIREVLTLSGYTVIDTGDPIEARRIAERQPIQLLLTDVVMPIMNGIELAQRVEAASPTTKVSQVLWVAKAAAKVQKVMGMTLRRPPYLRMSTSSSSACITEPAPRNMLALKNPWVSRWKIANA